MPERQLEYATTPVMLKDSRGDPIVIGGFYLDMSPVSNHGRKVELDCPHPDERLCQVTLGEGNLPRTNFLTSAGAGGCYLTGEHGMTFASQLRPVSKHYAVKSLTHMKKEAQWLERALAACPDDKPA
jgi:hypothetical protein